MQAKHRAMVVRDRVELSSRAYKARALTAELTDHNGAVYEI